MPVASGCNQKDSHMKTDSDIRERAVNEVIHSRKSVRSFTGTPVSTEDLEELNQRIENKVKEIIPKAKIYLEPKCE